MGKRIAVLALALIWGTLPASAAPVQLYDVRVAPVAVDGQPADDARTILVDLATREWTTVDGVQTVRVLKGKYAVWGSLDRGAAIRLLAQPSLEVDRASELRLDFQQAKPVRVTTDQPGLRPRLVAVGARVPSGDGGSVDFAEAVDTPGQLYLGVLGRPVPGMISTLLTQWGVPGAAGDFADSPTDLVSYDVRRGSFFNGFERAVRGRELAKVVSSYRTATPGSSAMIQTVQAAGGTGYTPLPTHFRRTPKRHTRFVEARGIAWRDTFLEWTPLPPGMPPQGDDILQVADLRRQPTAFQAGRTYYDQWNKGGFGPWSGSGGGAVVFASQGGIAVDVPLFSDSAGHRGSSYTDNSDVKIFRNGKLIGRECDGYAGRLVVEKAEPGPATYRIEAEANRSRHTLATKVKAAWTFRWDPAKPAVAPLWSAIFQPKLDANNRLKSTPVLTLPMRLERTDAAAATVLPQVWASGNDGKTWTRATVRRGSTGYDVSFPFASKHLSLRVKLGDGLDQTVIRAFEVAASQQR